MQSLCALKYYCRTCLMKLEECCADGEDLKRYVVISRFPEVEQLIRVCLGKRTGGGAEGDDDLDPYMPNLCRVCFDKWLDFARHYQLLIKNDEKLRKIAEKDLPWDSVSDIGEEANKVFIETTVIDDLYEIEKYETNLPFYQDSQSNTSIHEIHQIEAINTCENYIDDQQHSSSPSSPKSDKLCHDESSNLDATNDVIECATPPPKTKRTTQGKQSRRTKICKIKRKYKNKKITNGTRDKSSNGSGENSTTKKALYRCEPCKKYFYEVRRYEGHVKVVHEGIKKAFQCHDCGKAYKFYKNLTEHIADNHTGKPQENRTCKICGKEFKTQTTLKNHMKIIHPNPNDSEESSNSRRVICDQCGFLAASPESLAAHIKNKHTEAEQFKCEQCPKVFKCRYYLKHHIMSHHNPIKVKPFKCTECDTAFSRRNGLNKHKLTHLNYTERIKCDFEGCDVRFLNADAKRRHTRLVHLKVKQHICDICGEAFGIKATLRHHRYIHTGEKPYKCNVCGQAFRQHTAMKTHSKTHSLTKSVAMKPQDLISSASKTNVNLQSSLNIF